MMLFALNMLDQKSNSESLFPSSCLSVAPARYGAKEITMIEASREWQCHEVLEFC
jgi:hypothetical protein